MSRVGAAARAGRSVGPRSGPEPPWPPVRRWRGPAAALVPAALVPAAPAWRRWRRPIAIPWRSCAGLSGASVNPWLTLPRHCARVVSYCQLFRRAPDQPPSAATPGRVLPSSHSRKAPPADGDVAHLVEHAGVAQRRHRVAAAGDAAQRFRPRSRPPRPCASAMVAASNGGVSKAPSGPFQTSVFSAASRAISAGDGRRADIEDHRVGRHRIDRHGLRRHVRLQFARPPRHRSAARPRSPRPCARARMSRAVACISASCSERPTALPCAARNVLAIAPPITSTFTLADQVAQQVQLGGDLGAADDRRHRPHRIAERRVQRLQFRLHQPAGVGGQQMRHALGAGMRAMRGGEGVVHVDVGQLRQRRRRRRGRSSPPRRGSGCSPAPARRRRAMRSTACWAGRPMQSSAKRTCGRSTSPSAVAIGASDIAGTRLPFGRSKWLQHDDLGALADQFADRRATAARCASGR